MNDLPNGHVDLWWIKLESLVIPTTIFWSLLSADERERAERFRDKFRSQQFTCCRGALRMVLSRYLQLPPTKIKFQYSPTGKPSVVKTGDELDLEFNLSHSHEMLLIGVVSGHNIGVDLESRQLEGSLSALASQTLSAVEMACFEQLGTAEQRDYLLHVWTGKEAYVKGIGIGLRESFTSWTLQHVDARWHIEPLPGDPSYIASLAIDSAEQPSLPLRNFFTDVVALFTEFKPFSS